MHKIKNVCIFSNGSIYFSYKIKNKKLYNFLEKDNKNFYFNLKKKSIVKTETFFNFKKKYFSNT